MATKETKLIDIDEDEDDALKLSQEDLDQINEEEKYVKDHSAFIKYKKFKYSPILSKKAIYTTSDGIKIHLGMLPHNMSKKIEHLTPAEQEKIVAKREIYRKFLSNATRWKSLAFGLKINSTDDTQNNLLYPKKAEIIDLFSRMFSLTEVHEIVCKEWKLPVALDTLQRFKTKYTAVIAAGVERHQKKFSDVRLGVKRSRLEELSWLYNMTKDKYKKTPNRGDHEVLLKTLEAVRKEVEGDKLLIEGGLEINMDSTVSIHLQREVFKGVNINSIIIARMGARLGVPTEEVISRLLSSHYSKFSGIFSNPVDKIEEGDYPSVIPYDFDKIKGVVQQNKVNADIKSNANKVYEAEIVQTVVKSDMKSRLMAVLEEKKEGIRKKFVTSEKAANSIISEQLRRNLKKKPK